MSGSCSRMSAYVSAEPWALSQYLGGDETLVSDLLHWTYDTSALFYLDVRMDIKSLHFLRFRNQNIASRQAHDQNHYLHIPATSDADRLSIDIAHEGARQRQNRARRLGRSTWSSQRDICVWVRTSWSSLLSTGYAERNLCAISRGDESTCLLCCRQARENVAKGNSVGADAELGTPSTFVSISVEALNAMRKRTPLR